MEPTSKRVRKASHAGSWYAGAQSVLSSDLEKALSTGSDSKLSEGLVKGVIVPHAGYRFSLPTAACAFVSVNPDLCTRVIVMGPSHHAYFQGCGLPECTSYSTPLGDLEVDSEAVHELAKVSGFVQLDQEAEEAEHSLEMQLPLVRQVFGARKVKLLPIMVGRGCGRDCARECCGRPFQICERQRDDVCDLVGLLSLGAQVQVHVL